MCAAPDRKFHRGGRAAADGAATQLAGAAGAGTTVAIANGIDITAKSSLVVLDKASSIYIEESRSLVALASANTSIDLIASYEDITNL